jgi:putative transcriptional regulator
MKNSKKVERPRKGIIQLDLPEKDQASRQTINSIEAGKYVPSTGLALKISRVFGVGLEEIFELEEGD